ncbi:MAG: DUF4124 domain-containing protein [Gammaproteobacteria bacterium]|nr:DUF4124 domain-containing protein [Gammaproteobacteria bacterium]MBQ0839546.1 DUF4124 domain-containing protein [Gammaproteobacteria bacterium]
MIKQLIFRIIMSIVIATGIMSYIASINGIDIRQFLPTFERPKLPNLKLPTLPDIQLPNTDDQDIQPASVSKIYKWRDNDGSWHYSENLPEGVTGEKVIFLNADTNIVKSLPVPDKINAPIAPIPNQPGAQQQSAHLKPYSKQAIDKLLNDVRGVQQIMDQRSRDLEQATQSR